MLVPCVVFGVILWLTGIPNSLLRRIGESVWSENQAPVSLFATAALGSVAAAGVFAYETLRNRPAPLGIWNFLRGPRDQIAGWLTTFAAMSFDLGAYVVLVCRPGLPPRGLGVVLAVLGVVIGGAAAAFSESTEPILTRQYDTTLKDALYWRRALLTMSVALAVMAGWVLLTGRAFPVQ